MMKRALPVHQSSAALEEPLNHREQSAQTSALGAVVSWLLQLSRALGRFFAAGGPLS
jgi:hypothetical protein